MDRNVAIGVCKAIIADQVGDLGLADGASHGAHPAFLQAHSGRAEMAAGAADGAIFFGVAIAGDIESIIVVACIRHGLKRGDGARPFPDDAQEGDIVAGLGAAGLLIGMDDDPADREDRTGRHAAQVAIADAKDDGPEPDKVAAGVGHVLPLAASTQWAAVRAQVSLIIVAPHS
ncbi:MAG: hypothetical protein ACI93G_001181 [Hyphomonas sp.]|jgi:hypothetical protein